MNVEQRNVTSNQSTADYSKKKVFLFDNRFAQGTLTNDSDPEVTWAVQSGQLVYRKASGTNLTLVATSNVLVGVLKIDGPVDVLANASLTVDYGTKGTINGLELVDIAGDALNLTNAAGLALKDALENIGLHVDTSTVEHTKFDN